MSIRPLTHYPLPVNSSFGLFRQGLGYPGCVPLQQFKSAGGGILTSYTLGKPSANGSPAPQLFVVGLFEPGSPYAVQADFQLSPASGQQDGSPALDLTSIFPTLITSCSFGYPCDWYQVCKFNPSFSQTPAAIATLAKTSPIYLQATLCIIPHPQSQCSPQARPYLLLSHHTAARPRPCRAAMITLTS